jgi:transmembrane sensor
MISAKETEETAAMWLLRREEAEWSADQQGELDAWLDAAPEHRVAFYRLEFGWNQADRLVALRRPNQQRPLVLRARLFGRRFVAASTAAAACLLLGAYGLFQIGWVDFTGYRTPIGGQRTITLDDGSKVELNTDTYIRARITADARTVWLERGEAFFAVAHDPQRRFVVHVGTRDVAALGTQFSVHRDGDRVEVAVLEGRVEVEDTKGAAAVSPVIVTRGDTVVTEGASVHVATNSIEHVDEVLSWRHGVLAFDQLTLAEAASQFNRYNKKKLIITDPAVGSVRIGGRFDANNVQAFARLLHEGFGLTIEDAGTGIKISR